MEGKVYKCVFGCEFPFKTSAAVIKHMTHKCRVANQLPQEEKKARIKIFKSSKHKCPYCGHPARTKDLLNRHLVRDCSALYKSNTPTAVTASAQEDEKVQPRKRGRTEFSSSKRKNYKKRLMKRDIKYEKFAHSARMRIVNGGAALAVLRRKKHRCYRHRLRFDECLACINYHERALSFAAVLMSCPPPRVCEKAEGAEGLAQGKPDVVLDKSTYTQYRVTTKIADNSCSKPIRMIFFSRDPHGVPPVLAENECALVVVDNGRVCRPHGNSKPLYLSANDTSGWAVYSLDGKLNASHNFKEIEDLQKALEGAKKFAAQGAKYMSEHPEETLIEEAKDKGR